MQIDTAQPFEELLYAWGRWSASCNERTEAGSYSIQPFVVKKGAAFPPVDEETLLMIDRAIAMIFHKDEQAVAIIHMYFESDFSLRKVAKTLNDLARNDSKYVRPNNRNWSFCYVKQLLDIYCAKLEGYVIAKIKGEIF